MKNESFGQSAMISTKAVAGALSEMIVSGKQSMMKTSSFPAANACRHSAGPRLLSSRKVCARPLLLKCMSSLCAASAQSEDSYENCFHRIPARFILCAFLSLHVHVSVYISIFIFIYISICSSIYLVLKHIFIFSFALSYHIPCKSRSLPSANIAVKSCRPLVFTRIPAAIVCFWADAPMALRFCCLLFWRNYFVTRTFSMPFFPVGPVIVRMASPADFPLTIPL